MSTLYIYTENVMLRTMLVNMVNNRRSTDSGFDIPMLGEVVNQNKVLHTFDLGIKVAATYKNQTVPSLLVPRSSISSTPFRLANSIGVIDMGYRGEVKAKVDVLDVVNNFVVTRESRLFQICQGNFMPWDTVVIVDNENELPKAPDNRGEGGFGSTN
jgi:dUTP pyrophosphatase